MRNQFTHPQFTPGTVGPWPDDRKLRAWQGRALKTIGAFTGASFLLEACPAAGKTIPGLRFAHERLAGGRARRVLVLVPTVELAVQWAREAAHVGLRIEPNWQSAALP